VILFSDISDLMEAAVAYVAAGNYAAARDKALAAQALASVLPDTSRSAGDGGSQSLTWDRIAISQFTDRMQRLTNGAAGIQVSLVELNAVGAEDDEE
jgi:hypothetical protein